MEKMMERLLASQEEMRAEMKAATETNNEKCEILQRNMWRMRQEPEAKMHSLTSRMDVYTKP
jgi:hypothetical protein